MKFKNLILIFLVTGLSPLVTAQTSNTKAQDAEEQQLASERSALLSNLQSLDEQASHLSSLSRALVKAEIADAAWSLDREWAKTLLTRAYQLTLPSEDERNKLRSQAVGSQPTLPLGSDRARRGIRNRIVQIATREKGFGDQLIHMGVDQMGKSEAQMAYATLAESARQENDLDAAGKYLLQSVESDPSQITAGYILAEIAKTDRARADELIIEYFKRLTSFPLSGANNSVIRVYLVVDRLAFPPPGIKPPSGLVMKAYVYYVIQSFGSLEAREPGSLVLYRPLLLRARLPLNQYAPELMSDFLLLEQRSRGSNGLASVDTADVLGRIGDRIQENKTKDGIESDVPNERVIGELINRNDFAKARKLVGKLEDGPEKVQLSELVNAKEAIYFLRNEKIMEARQLAERLRRATSIREVYTALIAQCVNAKDEISATNLMVQAMKQLKASDPTLSSLPSGITASFSAGRRDFDPILDGMAKLTLAIAPISIQTAMIGLGETVAAANTSAVDTSQGRVGFDISIFKRLAPKDEMRVRQAAESFNDPLRGVLSLAAIDQWKSANLDERYKTFLQTRQKGRIIN